MSQYEGVDVMSEDEWSRLKASTEQERADLQARLVKAVDDLNGKLTRVLKVVVAAQDLAVWIKKAEAPGEADHRVPEVQAFMDAVTAFSKAGG